MARAFSEAFSGVLSGAFSRAYSKSATVVALPDRSRPELSLPGSGLEPTLPHRCLFRARELSETTILIAAIGEVGEANADDLIGYVQGTLSRYGQLVLDLSRVDFFDKAAAAAIHTLSNRCTRLKIDWVMVPSPQVEHALQVYDAEGALPTAGNIVSAVAALTRSGRGRLRLAGKPV